MFNKFATKVTLLAGSPGGFFFSILLNICWAVTADKISFNDIITMITFSMVFIIQYTQNKDASAFHLKHNELIKAMTGARNEIAGIEEKSLEEIKQMKDE